MTGIFGNSKEDKYRERELDRYLDSKEWTKNQIENAKDALFDDIYYNGEAWDENLEGYRMDMLLDIENIVFSMMDRQDKMIEINDITDKYIRKYCEDAVEGDIDSYCEKYCIGEDDE